MPTTSRIAILDSHSIALEGLCDYIESLDPPLLLQIVGHTTDLSAVYSWLPVWQPTIFMIDITSDTLEQTDALIQYVRTCFPSTQILLMSTEEDLLHQARAFGADAYLSKYEAPEHVLATLQQLVARTMVIEGALVYVE